jgi:hypothetical protein
MERCLPLAGTAIGRALIREDDHFGFMAALFLCKQVEHARSILSLAPRRDTVLIARSMVEGLCLLLWAQDGDRALRWRAFAYVHDWRLMKLRESRGESTDPEHSARIESALASLGPMVLTAKAGNAKAKNEALPVDPYETHWHIDFRLRQFCREHGVEQLYTEAYDPFSDWHHWGVGGLGGAIRRSDDRIHYDVESLEDSAVSLAAAFQCVLQTTQVVSQRLDLGVENSLTDLRARYLAWHHESERNET